MKKVFRYIGIISLGFWNSYYHPIETKTDMLMTVLFWIGIIFFVGSYDMED